MKNGNYYFDSNATTPIAPEVLTEMYPFFSEYFANPSALYQSSRKPVQAIRKAKRQVAALLNADESEIIFTSGGTESNNTAIRAALYANPKKKEIVTTAVEHSSILKLFYQLEKEGYAIKFLNVGPTGELSVEELANTVSERTAVVSIMYANNETGVIFPIEEIGSILREKNILFHVDAVQCAGKFPLNLAQMPIDMLSLSAHKFYGPKGVGALYVEDSLPFSPLFFGGSQERGRRAGTENVPGIVGIGAAAHLAAYDLPSEIARQGRLRDGFEKQVQMEINGIEINGYRSPRISNTSSICFENTDSESLLIKLDQKGICVSSGSACMSGANEPSHVLKAMGYDDAKANSVIRFSFGRFTSQEEIKYLVSELKDAVEHVRQMRSKKELRQSIATGVE